MLKFLPTLAQPTISPERFGVQKLNDILLISNILSFKLICDTFLWVKWFRFYRLKRKPLRLRSVEVSFWLQAKLSNMHSFRGNISLSTCTRKACSMPIHFRIVRTTVLIWCASHTDRMNNTETGKQNVKRLSFLSLYVKHVTLAFNLPPSALHFQRYLEKY